MSFTKAISLEDRVKDPRTLAEMTGKEEQRRGDMSANPVTHKKAIQMAVSAKPLNPSAKGKLPSKGKPSPKKPFLKRKAK